MAINGSLDSIRMYDVCKYYKSKSALENISLEINRGETLILLGPNGSGKSTLLKLLATLYCCDLGEISIFGKDIHRNKIEIQRNTGILFDSIVHFDKLTGYENAWFFARSYGLKPKKAESRIQYLFDRFNIWNNRNQAVSTYSYGMRRKLAIIEAMIHEPEVILLDEPSMGLDYTSRLVLYDILQNELGNTTIILATNDVDEATIMAQKIALLHKGQLLTIGSLGDLTSSVMDLSRIDLKLSSPLPLNKLRDVKGVKYTEINESQNEDFQLQFLVNSKEEALANIVNKVVELGGKVKSIDTHEPTLKDVFLKYIERSGSEKNAA
jgi:ABC-2 type transport system ATP-binding protein